MTVIIKKNWLRPRGYIHFTKKQTKAFSSEQKHLISYVTNPKAIKSHSFYPLIHKEIVQRRFKKSYNSEGIYLGRKHSYIEKDGFKKSNAKARQIFYSTHKDAVIYSYYTEELLAPKYERYLTSVKGLSDCVSSYRKIPVEPDSDRNKCNIHFANDVFQYIKTQNECVALSFDISKFFDSLNHSLLKKAWCNLLDQFNLPEDHYNVYKSLTKFSFVEFQHVLNEFGIKNIHRLKDSQLTSFCDTPEDFRKRIVEKKLIRHHPFKDKLKNGKFCGIPQGTPISAFISNLYMLKFDELMLKEIQQNRKGFYRRYSDDIIVVCQKEEEEEVKKMVTDSLVNDFKLKINPDKVDVSIFNTTNGQLEANSPLQYLGFEFDGKKILIRNQSVAKYYRQMKRSIRASARMACHNKSVASKKRRVTTHNRVYRGKLFSKYSHLGTKGRKRNFYIYAKEASSIMSEPSIILQLSKSWDILVNEIVKQEKRYLL